MEYYIVSGCRYSRNHRWISQPLSCSPHGGIFKVLPKFYQDYEEQIRKKKREKQERENKEKDKRANDFFKRFFGPGGYSKGFYGWDSNDSEPKEQQDPNYPFNVFGLKKSASDDDVKKAYRKSILKTHPDKPGGSTEAFRKIQEAWEYFTSSFA